VKRIVFIVVTLALLLLSEAVTLLATKAATTPGTIHVEDLSFFYKEDEAARYLDLKNQWQSEHRGEIPPDKAAELAEKAYKEASVESPLLRWREQGGPNPQVFSAKAHLSNPGHDALINVSLRVTLKAKVGDLRVNPRIQITDYHYLESSARWVTLSDTVILVPAIAAGEDLQVDLVKFPLRDFLGKHNGQWPAQLRLELQAPHMDATYKTLSLMPDHFVVPVLY
jgi:hypothetical protein